VPAPLTEFNSGTLASVLLAGDDTLVGNAGNDILNGHGGRDFYSGNGGNDVLVLDADTVIGPGNGGQYGFGNGGPGFDTIMALGSADLNIYYLLQVDALTFAGNTDSEVKFSGNKLSPALTSNFKITGDSHANTVSFAASSGFTIEADLSGFTFADWSNADKVKLSGGSRDDTLIGSKIGDIIKGGAGEDTLTGGRGKDILTGDAGPDFFDFNSIKESVKGGQRDVITDFKRSQGDKIDLKGIDAKTGVSGNQKFAWIGKDDFSGVKGELRYKDLGAKVIVQGDVNGDGKADFEILVKTASLNAGDFLL